MNHPNKTVMYISGSKQKNYKTPYQLPTWKKKLYQYHSLSTPIMLSEDL